MSTSKNGIGGPPALVAVEEYSGKVVFQGESAGYKNALGMYTIADDGSISDVRIVFANASLKNSGGDLVAGKSAVGLDLAFGDRVGFFVVPDGYSQSGMDKLLSDTKGSFKLVDAKGNAGNVDGGVELKLVHVSEAGKETVVKSAYGTSIFHSVDDGSKGLNGDGLNHVKTSVDVASGTVKLGFEDLKGGGDKDYDDTVLTLNVGKANAAAISAGTAESQVAEVKAKAEQEAKDKAEAEAKAKAEQEAKEKAEAEAKAKAEQEAKDKAEAEAKAKAEQEAKEKAEAEAKAKAEQEAVEKAEAEAKAKAEQEAVEKAEAEAKAKAEQEAKEKAEAEANEDDALVVKAKDVADFDPGMTVEGDGKGNDIAGVSGNDHLAGRGGDDTIVAGAGNAVTVPLEIGVDLVDGNNSETLSIVIGDVPVGAKLSAGHDNGDGTWLLKSGDLAGLTITGEGLGNFKLSVTASTEGYSNLQASATIEVTMAKAPGSVLQGNGGNDVLVGSQGADMMYGGTTPTGVVSTKPHVTTVADNDVLLGGDGDDHMWGNAGDDKLFGEAGNDIVYGGKDNDLVDGGDGNDELYGNSGDDTLVGGDGDDLLMGNSGNDELHDGAGNDKVDGGSGDDLVVAGEGDDSYNGASDYDVIDFSKAEGSMSIDLSKKSAVGMGNDVVWNFEKVIGSSFDDYMKGSKSAEHLVGGDGNDVLRGLGGADVLTGGNGSDTFQWLAKDVVDGKHLGADIVTDFSKEDVLVFSKMFKSGSFKSIDDVVKVVDDGASSHVFAAIGGEWQQVVTLEGVTGFDATTMHDNGMILV